MKSSDCNIFVFLPDAEESDCNISARASEYFSRFANSRDCSVGSHWRHCCYPTWFWANWTPPSITWYEVAIISPDNDAYNAWLVARKNVVIQFQSINPVIDPGSPVRLSTSRRLWDPEYDISSSRLNPLELNSWHHLTRRRTVGERREGAPPAAAFPASTSLPN